MEKEIKLLHVRYKISGQNGKDIRLFVTVKSLPSLKANCMYNIIWWKCRER